MTVDLWMLVYSAILCAVIPFVSVTGLTMIPGGLAWGFGNRDSTFVVPDWVMRTRRAHGNANHSSLGKSRQKFTFTINWLRYYRTRSKY